MNKFVILRNFAGMTPPGYNQGNYGMPQGPNSGMIDQPTSSQMMQSNFNPGYQSSQQMMPGMGNQNQPYMNQGGPQGPYQQNR